MNKRFKKLISLFPQASIDAYLVTHTTDITYLLDYPSADSWLLITPQKIFYFTDARYADEIRKDVKGVSVVCCQASLIDSVNETVNVLNIQKIGFDGGDLSYTQFNQIKKTLTKKRKLLECNGLVDQLRICKDKAEVDKIRMALSFHKKALIYLKRIIKAGQTEREIFFKLDQYVRKMGVGFSFDPIIASGPNSSYPHARISDRKITANDVVLVDMGIDFKGYKSDLTRMFFLGKIPKLIEEVCQKVKESQRRAIHQIKPGVLTALIDQEARQFLAEAKLEKYFTHSLGHGVGLDIHELPRLSQKDKTVLREGMIITVEPGVYIPHKFGIRLEEIVLVTRKGCEVLSDNIN